MTPNITIEAGPGFSPTLDNFDTSNIFEITPIATGLTLKNLRLINGQEFRGGAISITAADANIYLTPDVTSVLTINPFDIAGLPRIVTANGFDPATQASFAILSQIPDQGAHELRRTTNPDVDTNQTLDFFDVIEFLDIFDAATAP